MIVDRDEDFIYCAEPNRRGLVRVSLATGRAEAIRPLTRKEREMPISDREWREAAPRIARMLAGGAEPEGPDFAPIPASPWDEPARGGIGPLTAAERRARRPMIDPEAPDYAPIPAGLWDKRP